MKIKVAGFPALLIAGIVLTGCSNGGSPAPADSDGSSEPTGELTGIFDVTFKDTIEEIVTNFEKEYPDVDVTFDYQGGDVGGLVSTQMQAGTAPDILLTFPGGDPGPGATPQVVTYASQGKLLDLSDGAWTADVPEVWEPDVNFEDKTYGYPGAAQPLTAIYNQTTLDELGLTIPTTLDEVYQLCADAQSEGVYAYAQGLGEAAAGPQMLSFAQTATLVYGPEPDFKAQLDAGDVTYPDSAWVEQFEIYQEMFDKGCFGEGALGRSRTQGGEAVAAGKALAIVDVGAVVGIMQGQAPDTAFVVAPLPATNDEGETYVTALPGYTVAVNAETENPVAAKAFMEFLASPEQSAIYATGFSSVPILPNDVYEAPENIAPFAELFAEGNYAKLANLGPTEVQTALNEGVQAMLLGDATPEETAQRMQDAS